MRLLTCLIVIMGKAVHLLTQRSTGSSDQCCYISQLAKRLLEAPAAMLDSIFVYSLSYCFSATRLSTTDADETVIAHSCTSKNRFTVQEINIFFVIL